jgi:DNA-binding response OmpR family regulator
MVNADSMPHGLSTAKALIVEDDTVLVLAIEDELKGLGFSQVFHAARVGDALAIIERDKPDVAILDVNLDGDQVFPVAEKLDEGKVPFFFITAYPPETIPEEWAERVVLQKPVHPPRLRASVVAALKIGSNDRESDAATANADPRQG